MSYQEKINIYVPEEIGKKLDSDALLFEVFKKDGRTINRNRFLTMLITGYYNSYVTRLKETHDQIRSDMLQAGIPSYLCEEAVSRIMKSTILPRIPSRKGKNPTRLSLKPTRESEGIIQNILELPGNDVSVSNFFCGLFISYCEKPFSEREQIIFRDTYEMLLTACESGRSVCFSTIWKPEVIHEVIPYRLAVGFEEMYNYLLCSEINPKTGQAEARSYRLDRIGKIHFGIGVGRISPKIQGYLERMMLYGPQFAINEDVEFCIRMNEFGEKNYSSIYNGRPRYIRTEADEAGTRYYFHCSEDQLFFYFRKFSRSDAVILSPKSLRDRIVRFHRLALVPYQDSDS